MSPNITPDTAHFSQHSIRVRGSRTGFPSLCSFLCSQEHNFAQKRYSKRIRVSLTVCNLSLCISSCSPFSVSLSHLLLPAWKLAHYFIPEGFAFPWQMGLGLYVKAGTLGLGKALNTSSAKSLNSLNYLQSLAWKPVPAELRSTVRG